MAAAKVANVGAVGEIWSVVIANGATESDELATNGMVVWQVLVPSGWSTADLKFKHGYVTATLATVTDGVTDATDYTVQAEASKWSPVDPAKGIGAPGFCSIVASASQSGGDTLYVMLRYI